MHCYYSTHVNELSIRMHPQHFMQLCTTMARNNVTHHYAQGSSAFTSEIHATLIITVAFEDLSQYSLRLHLYK
jgi:hypothetical protein